MEDASITVVWIKTPAGTYRRVTVLSARGLSQELSLRFQESGGSTRH